MLKFKLFSVWGNVIPQSFVIPNELKMFKQYLSEDDIKHDGNNVKASVLPKVAILKFFFCRGKIRDPIGY